MAQFGLSAEDALTISKKYTEKTIMGEGAIKGKDGADGKSAYDLWLEAGNVGSEQDFLDSLKGADGTMSFDDLTEEQKESLKGADGKSAYQYAKDGGYIGTETEFTTNIARSGVISKELEVERARIDNLTTLQDGSTTGDAELIDARIDKDGNTYVNVGEHIRTVSSQLSSEIEEVENEIGVLSFTIKDNVFINEYGFEISEEGFCATDYIPICYGVQIATQVGNDNSRHAFYDKNKVFISAENDYDKSELTTVTVPDNAYYIRVSCYKNQKSQMKVKNMSVFDSLQTVKNDNLEQNKKINNIRSINYTFDNITFTNGIYISEYTGSEGHFTNDSESCATDYIRVIGGNVLKVDNAFVEGYRTIAIYNRKKVCLTCTNDLTFKLPNDAIYVRATGKANICPTFEYVNIVSETDVDRDEKVNGYRDLYATATKYPVLSIIDDDTWESQYVNGLKTICDTLGIKISFACLTSRFEEDSNLVNTLLQLEREGHTILTHGYSQGEFYADTLSRDIVQAEADLVRGLQDLAKNGFTDYKACWVTPFGGYDDELKTLAIKWGFESLVRYTLNEEVENPKISYPVQRYQLYRYQYNGHDSVAKIKELINKAVECNGWFIFGVHSAHSVCQGQQFNDDMNDIITYARNKGVKVRTLNEELRRRMPIYNNYEKF